MSAVYPFLGAGVGLRAEHQDDLARTTRPLDWVEVLVENHAGGGRARAALEQARGRWPVVPHGVCLDVGGLDPLDADYLAFLRDLCARVDAPHFSDHLVYSRLDGVYLHDLLPLPFDEAVARHVARRIEEARERVGRPFLLENPSYYAVMPGSSMDEAAFLSRVLELADCGLLLDVNNVFVNASNHGYDPRAFVDALPLERVGYVHLAGHDVRETVIPQGPEGAAPRTSGREAAVLIDTHGAAVAEPVWALFEHVLERTGPVSTLVERDHDLPPLNELLDEADRARAALRVAGARRPAGASR